MELPSKIAVRTEVLQRGIVSLDEKVVEVRKDNGDWEPFKRPGWSFTQLILWLMKHGYVVDRQPVGKRVWEGHTQRTYFYRQVE